ncbi:MAG: AEC family transporter [Puniceicoccaceae bacterium]
MLITIFNAFVPVFLNGVLGFWLSFKGWLGGQSERGLIQSLIFFFYPGFIFASMIGRESLRSNPSQFLIAPLLGYIFIVLGFVVAGLLAKPLGLREKVSQRSFAFATGVFNFGYLAIPLVTALHGPEILPTLFLFNAGVDLAIWSAGILTLTGSWNRGWYRKAINPPFLAIVLAVFLTYTGMDRWIPEALIGFARQIGAIAIPIGLLLTGSVIYSELFSGKTAPDGGRSALLGGSLVRLLILPLLLLGLLYCLPLSSDLLRVAIVQAAMPTGVFTIVLARHYGGSPEISIRSAIPTQILAFLTTPFWIWIGIKLFDV